MQEEEGDLTMALGSGVTVCLERATGPKSLDIGSSRVEVSQQTPRPWVLNGQPCTFAAPSYLNKNGAVRVSLQPTLSSDTEGAHEITESGDSLRSELRADTTESSTFAPMGHKIKGPPFLERPKRRSSGRSLSAPSLTSTATPP